MSEIIKYNIEEIIKDIFNKKLKMMENCKMIIDCNSENIEIMGTINGYDPLRIHRDDIGYNDSYEKRINRKCWYYIVNLFNLQKYMLCTDYDRMMKEIEDNKIPDFTIENVLSWVRNLKELVYDNMNTLVKSVFEKITNGVYYTGGSSWNNQKKKKRNNNGIDKFFILNVYDYSNIFNHYNLTPTLTDDLEKAVYILDGKTIPEEPIKKIIKDSKLLEAENDYFKIKICKNNNTHYTFKNERILNLLNLIGSGKQKIGENIKIKVFDKI